MERAARVPCTARAAVRPEPRGSAGGRGACGRGRCWPGLLPRQQDGADSEPCRSMGRPGSRMERTQNHAVAWAFGGDSGHSGCGVAAHCKKCVVGGGARSGAAARPARAGLRPEHPPCGRAGNLGARKRGSQRRGSELRLRGRSGANVALVLATRMWLWSSPREEGTRHRASAAGPQSTAG
jgi:hypothetical protein